MREDVTAYLPDSRYAQTALAAAGVGLVLALVVVLIGVVDTILYSLVFVLGVAAVPGLMFVFRGNLPTGIGSMVAGIEVLLGQAALGHGYLVQTDDGWQICTGDRQGYYLDGTYHEISGDQNRSRLAKRPFAVVRHKDDDTWTDLRADASAAAQDVLPDSDGTHDRGGFDGASPPTDSGLDGRWVVDLTRVFTRGVRKIGNIEPIETAEEIAMRDEASDSRVEGWEPVIASVLGLIIGIATGWLLTAP